MEEPALYVLWRFCPLPDAVDRARRESEQRRDICCWHAAPGHVTDTPVTQGAGETVSIRGLKDQPGESPGQAGGILIAKNFDDFRGHFQILGVGNVENAPPPALSGRHKGTDKIKRPVAANNTGYFLNTFREFRNLFHGCIL